MRLLDRYLLRELLVPLGYCLGGFLVFWIAFDVFSNLSYFESQKLLLRDVVEYYVVKTPEFIVVVLPIALLLASLYALTNHARHHEITAIRAAGVSLWRLCAPYWGVGLAASVCLFIVNEWWAPSNSERGERIMERRIQTPEQLASQNIVPASGLINLREGRTWMSGSYNPDTARMTSPRVIWNLNDGSQIWLVAASAIRTNGVWTFFDARELKSGASTNSTLVPVLHTNILAMPQFEETPEEILSEINISKGLSLKSWKRADIPISQILDYLRLHPRLPDSIQPWLYTKLHGRLAAPFTCLVVVLIAIPFGAASGRRNVFVGVASSLFICVSYFVLQQFGLSLGTGGFVRAWLAAWFPNLAFAIAGIWMISRSR